jgi:fumarylacetoacetase
MPASNATHDPARRSCGCRQRDRSHFPIQNLPFGIFDAPDRAGPRAGVAIDDCIVDLAVLAEAGLLVVAPTGVFAQPGLNAFIARAGAWSATALACRTC